ncbi:YigZ family protein [Tepidibacter sp. Z1-5]|uniref:YigZ family protein n=1 Tax=Tepidibacter sp. Z1-5 TaxID=3134138 RepID=UPI004040AD0F
MIEQYKTIHEYGQDEVIIEKSRFIGYAKPVETEDEAREFINEIKKKHKDATHNVWAYTVGMNMDIQRYSDDGEPSGTAGIPTLEVIKKEDLRNVAVVVTRYFGGIKLGAGGLVRAYTKGAKVGLNASKIIDKILYTDIRFKIDYTLLGKVQNELMNLGYIIKEILYEDMVTIVVYSKLDEVNSVKNKIIDITSSNVEVEEKEDFYLSKYNDEILLD